MTPLRTLLPLLRAPLPLRAGLAGRGVGGGPAERGSAGTAATVRGDTTTIPPTVLPAATAMRVAFHCVAPGHDTISAGGAVCRVRSRGAHVHECTIHTGMTGAITVQ